MRRFAVVLALALACTGMGACGVRKLYLPPDEADGGIGGSGGAAGRGGAGGSQDGSGGRVNSSGGAGGAGGRASGTGGRPATGGMTGMCAGQRTSLKKENLPHPYVVLTVGRNASMVSPFGNTTRMTAVQQAVRTVVMANQRAVNFAYQDFPDAQACGGTSCCVSKATFPSLGNFFLIDQELACEFGGAPTTGCASQSPARPIAEALRNVLMPPGRRGILDDIEDADLRVILLVDGGPGCYGDDGPAACESAQQQVARLRNAVRTHVLPISEDAEKSSCLAGLSLQGDIAATPAQPFPYRARDPDELRRSLTEIVSDAAKAACTITLLDIPTDSDRVSLEILGLGFVPKDETGVNGWRYARDSRGTIEVNGGWCGALQNTSDLNVKVWECE